MSASRDRLAREADYLAVFVDGLIAVDGTNRELVAHAHTAVENQRCVTAGNLGSLGQVFGGDGDVVLRPKLNCDLAQRYGGHGIRPSKSERESTRQRSNGQ